jgi:probable F420-dependent oxidoreductase
MSSRPLEIGFLLPHTGRAAGPGALREVASAAEELGADSLWVGDHFVLPAEQSSVYPYGAQEADGSYEVPVHLPFMEAFASLAYTAAVTTRCRLGISVGIVPYRHLAVWAKQVGTLDVLAEGRFILGVGVGWLREEFEALGADFSVRGRQTDEVLGGLHQIWSQAEPAPVDGDLVAMRAMHVVPGSGLEHPPKVWVGGNGKAARRRTAQFGDVWHPHIRGTTPRSLRDGLDDIRAQAPGYGRDAGVFSAAAHAPLVLAAQRGPDPAMAGRIEGPPGYLRETLEEYAEAGLDHVILSFGGAPASRVKTMETVMEALA